MFAVSIAVFAAALGMAAGVSAEPAPSQSCSGLANVAYALEIATGNQSLMDASGNCVRCKCEACYPSACQCDVYCFCNKQPWTTGGELAQCLRQFNDMWCPGEPNPLG